MSKRGSRMEVSNGEINLIPIMGVMLILIPMVLLAYNFEELRVQQVATPRLGSTAIAGGAKEDERVPLKLAIHISAEGFKIKANEVFTDLQFPEIPKQRFQVTTAPGKMEQVLEYDYPRLHSVLRALKDQERFDKEDSIDLSAEMSIPWSVVASTIDAARAKLETVDFRTVPNYEQALELYRKDRAIMQPGGKVSHTDGKPLLETVTMFPKVVFTVAEIVN